jgi:ankyrin repeat protein
MRFVIILFGMVLGSAIAESADLAGSIATNTPVSISQTARGEAGLDSLKVALLKAAEEVDEKAVAELLRQGANANAEDARGWTPLILAAQTGNVAMVRTLISAGANVNHRTSTKRGSTALCFGVGGGNLDVVRAFLDSGADVNGKSRDGMTPLYFAASLGALPIAELLISKGADVDLFANVDSLGGSWNPLIVAVDRGRLEMVQLLLKHGAKSDVTNNKGFTVFMEVAKRPQPDVLKQLIEKGANVNARGPKGHTALIFAAYNGRTENVRLLIDAGADLHAQAEDEDDPSGKLKFDAGAIAYQRGHKEITAMIQQAVIKRLGR